MSAPQKAGLIPSEIVRPNILLSLRVLRLARDIYCKIISQSTTFITPCFEEMQGELKSETSYIFN